MTDKMLENSQAEMRAKTDDDKREELYKAAQNGGPQKVRLLLEKITCTYDTSQLLFNAIVSRNADTVGTVLERGADPNSRNHDGEPALYFAATRRLLKTVEVLLQYGATPNSRDPFGETSVWIAAKNGMLKIVEMLVRAGADPHIPDYHGYSPFWMAAALGHIDTALFLMQHCKADPNTPNGNGQTPLYYAALNYNAARVLMLVLSLGANPNTRNNRGQSAVAAALPSTKTVRVLVHECGADPDIADDKGITPIMIAAMNGREDMVRVLVEAGVDLDSPDGNGVPPILHAARYAHDNLVWLLARECRVDLSRKKPRLAFAMGQHRRLGAESPVSLLSPDVVHLILIYVSAPWIPPTKDSLYGNSLPLYKWLMSIEDAPPAYAEHNAGLLGSFQCSICNHATEQAVALVPCGHRVCRQCLKSSCPICQAAVYHKVPQEQFPDQVRLLM